MERKKSYILLIVSAVIVVAALVSAIITRNSSYAKSVEIGDEVKSVKAQIEEYEQIESPSEEEVVKLAELKVTRDALSDNKLEAERPYSFSLAFLFLGLLMLVKGILDATVGFKKEDTKVNINKLTQAALMAALCYIGFAFFKIDIPVGTEKTAFHFGNVFCVLAALLIDGYYGGLAGAVGMTIGDLLTSYVTSAPKTFLLKLIIGLIVGTVAHKIFKLNASHSKKFVIGITILSSACGMIFNIIADPLVGYFYKSYLLGVPQDLAATLAKINLLTTSVNAITAVVAATIIYLALRPALNKAGLLLKDEAKTKEE